MRIGALSEIGEVSVPTLKYYIREGLLPPGTPTAANQADYGAEHVQRVRLIRALIEIGGMSISDVKAVIAEVANDDAPIFDAMAVAQDAAVDVAPPINENSRALARECANSFIEQEGFTVRADAASREELAAVLERMAEFGIADLSDPTQQDIEYFGSIAEFCRGLASYENDLVPDMDRSAMVSYGVVGVVLSNAAISAIHRIALEDAAASRYGPSDHRSATTGRSNGM